MKRLHRNPILAAERLQIRNRILRWAASPARTIVLVALSGVSLVVVLELLREAAQAGAWMTTLELHWPIVLASASLYAAATTSHRRRRAAQAEPHRWLSGAPLSSAMLRVSRSVRLALPLLAQAAAATLMLIWCALGAAHAPMRAIACLWAGAACGALLSRIGFLRGAQQAREDSRYAPRARSASALGGSLAALSRWPVAQAFAWGRPENLRALVIVCLLLGVQAGSSALHGLLIVGVWLAGAYLISLLLAAPRAARAAAAWLRTTPIEFGRFAWAIARRALLHQAIGSAIAAAALGVMGAPASMLIYFGSLWAAIVVLVYAVATADAYRGKSSTMKLALSFASMAAIESRLHAWSVPAVLLFAAWTLRRAHR